VRVLNFFEFNGTAYLVMEYEEGRSLARLIEIEPLDNDQILEILPALLSGLDEVHAAGIQHRDIKPANIYIRRTDATPVLIDFGSARQAIAQRTRTTSMVRSDGYSPYEQYISTGVIGPWTDIYALGATLYHCMVGEPPSAAPDRVAAQRKSAPDPVAELPSQLRGRYDERLCAAVVAALSLDESDRPQSIDEFRKLGRIARRAFSRERPSGDSKAPPVEGPVRQSDGGKKTPPPPKAPKHDEGGKKGGKPKGEEKAGTGKEPPPEERPRRTMLMIAGISIAVGLLIALLGCIPCISQSGPILFGLFVSSAALALAYFLTWRGSQISHTILVVLTLIYLGLGFVMLLAVSTAARPSDLAIALAVGGIVVGWTGIPLLVMLIRGARMHGAGARVGAK
jgi:serine/threonine protein kinase